MSDNSNKQEVVVTDIKMGLDSMITFILKWIIATFIAGVIIFLALMAIGFITNAIIGTSILELIRGS